VRRVLTAFVAVAAALTAVTSYFAFSPTAGGVTFWALAAGTPVLLGAVAAGWAAREGVLREWLRPHWGDATRGLLGAAALYATGLAFVRLLAAGGSPREIWLVSLYAQIGDPRSLQAHAPALAACVVLTAAGEELIWRGAVTWALEERVGSRVAWVVSAAIYALSYLPTAFALGSGGTPNPILVLAALAEGLFWGATARAAGSLAPGILGHAFFTWAVVMMFPYWPHRSLV
jgi:membrane protease YdiL (CAAX protease family)